MVDRGDANIGLGVIAAMGKIRFMVRQTWACLSCRRGNTKSKFFYAFGVTVSDRLWKRSDGNLEEQRKVSSVGTNQQEFPPPMPRGQWYHPLAAHRSLIMVCTMTA